MSLFLTGDPKKIKDYRDRAEEDGLIVELYSELEMRNPYLKDQENSIALEEKIRTLQPPLRRTLDAVRGLVRATCVDVANKTGITDHCASPYLATLKRGGFLTSERVGRYVYYSLTEDTKRALGVA